MIGRLMLLFGCAALITASPAVAAESASASAPSRPPIKVHAASRVLIVQPGNFNLSTDDFYIVAKERERPKLIGTAVDHPGAITEPSDDQLGDWLSVGQNGNEIHISVRLPQSAPPVAAAIADDLVEFMRSYLVKEYEDSRKQSVARAQLEFDLQQRMAQEINQELSEIRAKLRDLSGRSDVSPKTLTSALSSMDDELQRLQIERLSKDARRQALEEQIAALTERVQKRIESDPIATELKKVVDAREEGVATLKKMYESGTSSRAELTQAVAQAAEAKAKLLQQQRDASAAAGGTSLEAFNRELMTLSIDAKELDTKTKYLEERLPRLRQAVELLDEYTRIDQRAKEMNGSVDVVTRNLQDAQAMNQVNNPPKVLVKESKNEREE